MKRKGERRGARDFGLTKSDREFLKPDFNRVRQMGERAVGQFATASNPGVVTNAQLEGDDYGNFGIDGGDEADFRRTSRNDGVAGKNQ